MAKEKRSAADLDAELAALEAELAALEGKKKGKKAEPKPAPPKAAPAPMAEPAPSAPAAAEAAAAPEAKPEKKARFAMPKFGKKKAEDPPPTPAPVAPPEPTEAPAPVPEPAPLAPAPTAAPPAVPDRFDSSVWRQDGDAWVRVVPETPVPIVRRVLDEEGNVVREEPAHTRDVEDASGVKAERGLGRLLRRK